MANIYIYNYIYNIYIYYSIPNFVPLALAATVSEIRTFFEKNGKMAKFGKMAWFWKIIKFYRREPCQISKHNLEACGLKRCNKNFANFKNGHQKAMFIYILPIFNRLLRNVIGLIPVKFHSNISKHVASFNVTIICWLTHWLTNQH